MAKRCSKCGEIKSLDEFHKSKQAKDGLQSLCKACHKVYRNAHKEQERKRGRGYYHARPELKGRDAAYKATGAGRACRRRHYHANKYKYRAHEAVTRALRSGKLTALPCKLCGAAETVGHHADYSKPLDVYWLCCGCHKFVHRVLRAIKEPLLELDQVTSQMKGVA